MPEPIKMSVVPLSVRLFMLVDRATNFVRSGQIKSACMPASKTYCGRSIDNAGKIYRSHRGLMHEFMTASRSGSVAVEFALIIVPLTLFIFAIFQVALYHFSLQALDYATRTASRRIMVGEVQIQGLTAAAFKTDLLCPALTIPIPCSAITVNISPVAKTSSADLKTGIYTFVRPEIPDLNPANLNADNGSFCTGGPGTYVFVDVAYNYLGLASLTAQLFRNAVGANAMVLRSTSFVVNEPYPSGSAPAGAC